MRMTQILPPYEVRLHPASAPPATVGAATFQSHYPVRLADGSFLELPLRPLPGGAQAIALLMSNQTPFAVEDALGSALTKLTARFEPQAIVGVPTMGLDYARIVARGLGFPHYTAMGLSRKFWYDEELSQRMSSSTSPDQVKSVYLDPALLERVAGRRVVVVDDVINTGSTAAAVLPLLLRAGAKVEAIVTALTEGYAWRETLGAEWAAKVVGLGHIPIFDRAGDGWRPIASTVQESEQKQ
jgi:adenine/guanine phosphoribosyltransferase-like PRPP-binding protein